MKLKTTTVVLLTDGPFHTSVKFNPETQKWDVAAQDVTSGGWVKDSFQTSTEAMEMALQIMGVQNV